MQFSFPKLAWSPDIFDRLLKSIKDSDEKADYDTGWVATPTSRQFSHNLNALPSEVWVYASANADGSAFDSDTFTACTRTSITITGPKAYCRVRMNKGS